MRFWQTREVPGKPLVSMIVVAYQRPWPLRCLLASFAAQTYANFEVHVIHDGPHLTMGEWVHASVDGDQRFHYHQTPERSNQFGHPLRRRGIALAKGDYIGFANDDCYYVPVYFEAMLNRIITQRAQIVYCDMVHSHRQWRTIIAKPERKFIDAGNWLAKGTLIRATPWTDDTFAGDWFYFEKLKAKANKLVKVDSCLYTHN